MSGAWVRLSPQSLDPLSWYSRPFVTAALSALALGYGLVSVIALWRFDARPLTDILAVAVLAASCLVVQVRVAPFRRRFSAADGVVVLAIAAAGLALSSWANLDSSLPVQYWWAPVVVAVVGGVLVPYSSVRLLLCYGSVMAVFAGVVGALAFSSTEPTWPSLSVAVIAACPVVLGSLAATVFVATVVRRTVASLGPAEAEEDEPPATAVLAESRMLARLGFRVVELIERVAEAGVVTESDRALAERLGRRLQADLGEVMSRSWLEGVAAHGRVFVVDPDRRAERMNAAQRTALRALLTAVLRSPGADAGSLLIELRALPSGATAVAISLDLELSEGRRSALLEPFYLALQAAVDDLSWDRRRSLLRFAVPDRGPAEA
ncbi:MAG: hypothetical protein QM635_07570 [Microbacteriaceae bacterium]